ncbi:hypothetical protein VM1G_06674 [Cytospora mali]|uniref:Uncharacterized protein n=1 Tax=Cytospora mali TaxID=578113 RepID=A0A194W5R2_CYTMA|nr:hypothetical protein VM1G_06674 [Valsa mali]
MWNAFVDRAISVLDRTRTKVPAAPTTPVAHIQVTSAQNLHHGDGATAEQQDQAQPPAASQPADAPAQNPLHGDDTLDEQAVEAQTQAAFSTPDTDNAPVWTVGTFSGGRQQATRSTQKAATPSQPLRSPSHAGWSQATPTPTGQSSGQTAQQWQQQQPTTALDSFQRFVAQNLTLAQTSQPPLDTPTPALTANVAGTPGTGASFATQSPAHSPSAQRPQRPQRPQGFTRAELGIPEDARRRPRKEVRGWVERFFDRRQNQERAATAGGSAGSPGTAAGRAGSRSTRSAASRRPARTTAPTRDAQPATPARRTTRQGGGQQDTPDSPASPTPLIVPPTYVPTPVTATVPAPDPASVRRHGTSPLVAPRGSPGSNAFGTPSVHARGSASGVRRGTHLIGPRGTPASNATLTPAIYSPNLAPTSAPTSAPTPPLATGRVARGNIRRPRRVPRRVAVSSNSPVAPQGTPASNLAAEATVVTPSPAPTVGRAVTVDSSRPGSQKPSPVGFSQGYIRDLRSRRGAVADIPTMHSPGAPQRSTTQTASQQTATDKSSTQDGAQPSGGQQSWRSREDLFHPDTLDRSGIVSPRQSIGPPSRLPTAPSSIDSPSSILRKRPSDGTQTPGATPKRLRWNI